MKRFLIASMVVLLFAVNGQTAQTFFGEDLNGSSTVPLVAWPNATAASNSFMSWLSGVGTESFEGMTVGSPPTQFTFPVPGGTITADLTGNMTVRQGANTVGRYPTDGIKYIEGSTGSFSIAFSEPVAAFGFFGTDIGDFGGVVTLTTVNGGSTLYNIPHTVGSGAGAPSDGAVLFFGVIDTSNPFTSVVFGNTGAGTDFFGFDQMTVGTAGQVQPVIPAPGAILLSSIGVSLIGLLRRRTGL